VLAVGGVGLLATGVVTHLLLTQICDGGLGLSDTFPPAACTALAQNAVDTSIGVSPTIHFFKFISISQQNFG